MLHVLLMIPIPDIKTSDHKPVFALMECQIRPGKDTIPLNAGLFKRDVYIEALRRRAEENFGLAGLKPPTVAFP